MISNANLLVKQGLLKRPLDFGFVMGALSLALNLTPPHPYPGPEPSPSPSPSPSP